MISLASLIETHQQTARLRYERGAQSECARQSAADRQSTRLDRDLPRWLDRIAAGVATLPGWATSPILRARIQERAKEIAQLRRQRAAARKLSEPRLHFAVKLRWRGAVHLYALVDRRARRVVYATRPNAYEFFAGYAGVKAYVTRREAARAALQNRPIDIEIGRHYSVRRTASYWYLSGRGASPWGWDTIHRWQHRPTRRQIAAAVRDHRAAQPSRIAPPTLGWRAWYWDEPRGCLVSPHQRTRWPSPDCRADDWSDASAVRGESGVHARLMPRNWRAAPWACNHHQEGPRPAEDRRPLVTGIVERYGRYVLGTTGWRAEWVVIRELMAPDEQIADALRRVYPDVPVHVRQQEREASCA